jgi:hypothetical protein
MYWESQRGHRRILNDLQDRGHRRFAPSDPGHPASSGGVKPHLRALRPLTCALAEPGVAPYLALR